MEHPLSNNPKIIISYCAAWLVIIGLHFTILLVSFNISVVPAIADCLLSNGIFALLGVVLWYVVLYSRTTKAKGFNIFINNFTSVILIILIWLGINYAVMSNVFMNDAAYMIFLHNSIIWRILIGLFFSSIIVLLYYLIIYYNNLKEKLISENDLKTKVREAELNLLKSQINPHFLFNSLNSVSSLTITDPKKAQDMIIKLSDFLRYSVSQPENNFSTLEKEMENIARYLEIEKVRFGSKLDYSNDIPSSCLQMKIPLMILQPLYENAVKHGVYESTEQITITTTAETLDNNLFLKIINNLDPEAKSRKGAGIGLKNISERLRLIYGNETLLKSKTEHNIFTVQLIIPQ